MVGGRPLSARRLVLHPSSEAPPQTTMPVFAVRTDGERHRSRSNGGGGSCRAPQGFASLSAAVPRSRSSVELSSRLEGAMRDWIVWFQTADQTDARGLRRQADDLKRTTCQAKKPGLRPGSDDHYIVTSTIYEFSVLFWMARHFGRRVRRQTRPLLRLGQNGPIVSPLQCRSTASRWFQASSRPSNPRCVRVSTDGFRDVLLSPMAGSSDRSYCAVDTCQLE